MDPILYVNSLGQVSTHRPAPMSRLGVNSSWIAGRHIEGFVSLTTEPFLRELLWEANPRKYQQLQLRGCK